MYYTYILYSERYDKFYYGQTVDLSNRLDTHNSGKVSSTRRYRPWEVYAYKEVPTRELSMSIERKLKNLKSRKRVRTIIEKHEFVLVKLHKKCYSFAEVAFIFILR